jgi:hypothetical protein
LMLSSRWDRTPVAPHIELLGLIAAPRLLCVWRQIAAAIDFSNVNTSFLDLEHRVHQEPCI